MLKLSRLVNERIMIGNDIVITILDITDQPHQDQVKIGIEAPKHVVVLRDELCKDIKK